MPDYKKRKHSRLFSSPAKVKKSRIRTKHTDDIKMSPAKSSGRSAENNSNMKVVKGRKLENKRRFKIGAVTVAVILIIVFLFQMILPAGIIETVSSLTSLVGAGTYPIELKGSETVNTVSRGAYYYVLSNTDLDVYNNSGKHILGYAHGYENPVLKVSASRALVFEQGGNEALLFDLKKLKKEIVTEKPILTGAVSDNGMYALVTLSDKYASAVTVYGKNDRSVYEWYSAEDTVNNVVISPNGKKIAVSGFSSVGGQFKSKLNVLNFKSADAEYTESFDSTIIYNLDSSQRNGFVLVTEKGIKFIKWHKFKSEEYKNEYSASLFRTGKNGYIAVFNRESDKTDNRIEVFSGTGKLKAEFSYKGIVSDIAVSGNHIYCMSDTEIFLLDKDGKVLRKGSCGFGAVRLNAASANSVIVLTDNKIEKLNLE